MRDFKIYIAIASALLIICLVVQYNKPKPVDWQPTLSYTDQIPFGTYILYQQMKDIFPGAKVTNINKSLFDELHNDKPAPGNYIIITKNIKVTKPDYQELVKFISAGNTVFISSLTWNDLLSDTLKLANDFRVEGKGENILTLYINGGRVSYKINKNIAQNSFGGFDTTRVTVIGKDSAGYSNVLRFKFGKGSLIVCANPKLFTNYMLLKPEGAGYAAKVLSFLPQAKNIYWDEYQNGDTHEEESPVRVLLSYPSLQKAYYIALFSLIVFLLYETKRRQRIIPVIAPLKNATLDFVKVVGQVYYEKRDNSNIATKKILYWMSYLRDRYQLKTNKLDKDFTALLAQKTGIDVGFATDMVNFINYLGVQTRVSDSELIRLNELIEKFHTQS